MHPRLRTRLAVIPAFLIVLFSQAHTVFGDSLEERMRIERQKRQKLQASEERILAREGRLVWDYGGWIGTRFDQYGDDDNDSSLRDSLEATSTLDSRFWLKGTLRPRIGATHQNQHSVYLRFKDIYSITSPGDVNKRYNNAGPHLDQGYMVLDMRPWWLELGRRYAMVGQGIAYGNVHDGLELYANLTDWNLKFVYTHTLPHEDNIDLSVPGATRDSDRDFYGFEARYIGLPGGHSLYGFYLLQRDSSDEDPINLSVDYHYDSEYAGLGLQGKLLSQAHYWVEVIRQRGNSRVFGTGEKKRIDAWAGDFGVTYDMDFFSHPNVTVEYAFGSGDSDRVNVTDTENGNTIGRDHNFLYFGYLPTGYALAPRLSNLHVYKAAVLLNPLETFESFKTIRVGIEYYRFYKDKRRGGISDTNATVADKDIGSEIDLNLSWQILSDVTMTLEFGYFMPGDAYPRNGDDSEKYFSADVTLTF